MPERKPRIAFVTAGAAGMFCGSCLRDNALAAALLRQGCDILLIPTYTPIRTDEESVAIDKLFFGGINVFLQQKSSFFRRLPRFVDRVLDNPWLVAKLAARGIETEASTLGGLTVSMLKGERGNQRKEVRRLVDWLRRDVKPDLVNLTNILIAGCAPAIRKELKVPVLVNLQGDDLFLEGLPEPFRSQALAQIRRLARDVDGFVVFNRFYAEFMGDYLGIPEGKMHIVPLGVTLSDFQEPPSIEDSRPPTLGYLARVCPEKGFHLLMDAFLKLRAMPGTESLRLQAAGWLDAKNQGFLNGELEKANRAGAAEAVVYHGILERAEKIAFLRGLDAFSVPTVYKEPKGLFVLEALASGVPVVQPDHGAFPELLAATGGGKLFRSEDADHLAEVLHPLLRDRQASRRLGQEGRAGVHRGFGAEAMASATMRVYQRFLP